MSTETVEKPGDPARWVRVVTVLGAVAFLSWGLWALAAPESFFTNLASFDPYNPHLIHDIGAFQLGLGAVLLLAAFPQRFDALSVALLGVGVGAAAHVVSHLIDIDLGGTPATDIPVLSVLALLLLVAGASRLGRAG